jgi:AcrR family transcriptional regulator
MSHATPPISLTASLASVQSGKTDATRDQVLDAALGLFIEFGLRRTTMEDVAHQAGIGRATIYRRFGDKHQLVQAVILRECQQQLALIEQHLNAIETTIDVLLEAFVLAVTRAHRHPLLVRLLSSEPDTILPYLTTELPDVTSYTRLYLAAQISKAQAMGQLSTRPAEQMAELLLRLIQSLVLSPIGVIDPADERSVRQFANLFLRPVLAPESARSDQSKSPAG